MERFSLRKGTPGTIEFNGEKIADRSSRLPNQQRWTEIRIYRTEGSKYVTEVVGRSAVQGERDLITIEVVDAANAVADKLKRTQGNKTFLTDLALDALDEAASNDESFNEAEVL